MLIHIARNNQRLGTFTEDEVLERLATGEFAATDLGWHDGLDAWTPLGQFLEVPPPLPPAPPPLPPEPERMYLYIPIGRFIALSLLLPGLFNAYWLYMNWSYLRARKEWDIWPFWRAFFGIFWVHALFRAILNDEDAGKLAKPRLSEGWSLAWVVLSIVSNLICRSHDPYVSFGGIVLGCLTGLCLVPAQRYINTVNEAQNPPPPYFGWSTGQVMCLALGVFFWFIALAGLAGTLLGVAPPKA